MTNKKTNKKDENNIWYEFTPVNTAYRESGLKPLEILIMSTLDGFKNNGEDCWISDDTLANWYGVERKTVSRAMKSLEEKGFIKRDTRVVRDNGQASKVRYLNYGDEWNTKILQRSILINSAKHMPACRES